MLPGAVSSQGVQAERPVSVVLGKLVDGPNDSQPLDVFTAEGDAEEPSGL